MSFRKSIPPVLSIVGLLGVLGGASPALSQEPEGESDSAEADRSDEAEAEGDAPRRAENEERAQKAREAFVAGQEAFAAGRFIESAKKFEIAQELHPHAAVLFNIARAFHQAGELERAADAYSAALKRGELGYEQSNAAQETLEKLRMRVGWAKLSGAEGTVVSVEHRKDERLPLEVHLVPGEHEVVAVDAEGKRWTQSILIEADKFRGIVIAPPKEEKEPEPVVLAPAPRDDSARRRRVTWGFATLGVGAGLGVAAGILGGAALDSKAKYEATDPLDADLYSQTKSLRTWTNVAAFSGLAVGATGAVLLLTLPKKEGGGDREVDAASLGLDGVVIGLDRAYLVGRF